MRFFGALEKFDKLDDGTLLVTGIASAEVTDSDGELITADAIKAALPEYLKFANIREMHGNSAAGLTLSADVLEDGKTRITAKIVDSEAIKKVVAGVYKGFSIGGKVLQRAADNAKRITAIALREISLVDRPANPECVFDCWKAEKDELNNKPNTQKESRMDKTILAKALGLDPEKATEQEVAESLAKRLQPVDLSPLATEIEGLKKRLSNADLTKIESLSQTVESLTKRAKEISDEAAKKERAALVAEASRDGKVIPLDNEDIEKTEVSILRKMIDKLPKNAVQTKVKPEPVPQAKDELTKFISERRKAGIAAMDEFFKTSGLVPVN